MAKMSYEDFIGWTATNLFIVPTLGISRQKLLDVGFLNAFMDDEIKNAGYEGVVYLLFSPPDLEKFEDFLEEERRNRVIIEEYNYMNLIMVVCKYPKEVEEDVRLIQQGRFSEVSYNLKDRIKKTNVVHTLLRSREELTIQHQIFSKSKEILDFWWDKYEISFDKNEEVWSFYPEREIFNELTLNKYEHTKKVH